MPIRPLAAVALAALLALLPALSACGSGKVLGCLAAGTMVSTPAGLVAIETLQVGDAIYSVDPLSGTRVSSKITAVRTAQRRCLQVTTASGRTIRATADHPFYCVRSKQYVPLGELLSIDDATLASVSDTGTVSADRVTKIEPLTQRLAVYDLTVASSLHNFIAAGLLAHNKSPPSTSREMSVAMSMVTLSRSATAQPTVDGPAGTDPTAPVTTLLRDVFTGGRGLISVERATPFDAIYFMPGNAATIEGDVTAQVYGNLRIEIDPPATSVTLQVELAGDVQGLDLIVRPVSADMAGPDMAEITIPADG